MTAVPTVVPTAPPERHASTIPGMPAVSPQATKPRELSDLVAEGVARGLAEGVPALLERMTGGRDEPPSTPSTPAAPAAQTSRRRVSAWYGVVVLATVYLGSALYHWSGSSEFAEAQKATLAAIESNSAAIAALERSVSAQSQALSRLADVIEDGRPGSARELDRIRKTIED